VREQVAEVIPAFITSFGRYSMLNKCIASLKRFDLDVTVVDNTGNLSAWWDVKVVHADNTFRHLSPWALGLVPKDRPYIVCDEDIEIDRDCPDDLLDQLLDTSWPANIKVGIQIRTDDVPEVPRYAYSLNWERSINARTVHSGILGAEVDTHFAIYRTPINPGICGVRLAAPYQCRHLPWYNLEYTDEELDYYRRTGDAWAQTHSAGELCK
jgi:hypothetical protein